MARTGSIRKNIGSTTAGVSPFGANLRSQYAEDDEQASFSAFQARELYCPKCQKAMPVRERVLLVLPSGEVYDYSCAKCGSSLGTRRT